MSPGPAEPRDERVVAYLLGELAGPERASFEAEIAGDRDLRAEVAALEGVVSKLAAMPEQAWQPLEPPPLRIDLDSNPPQPVRDRGFWRRRLVLRPLAVGLSAVALVAAGAGVGVLATRDGGSSRPSRPSPSALATLAPIGTGSPSASGDVAVEAHSSAQAELDVSGLRPTGRDHFYELWLLDPDGRMVALGSFRVDHGGHASIRVPLPVNPSRYRFFDISLQRDSGNPAHSGISVLRGATRS